MAGNLVRALVSTPNGEVWIGTDRGLSFFDGFNFSNIDSSDGLTSNLITEICIGVGNQVWAGTRAGLNLISYSRITPFEAPEMLKTAFTEAIYLDSENVLWVSAGDGVYRVKGEFIEHLHSEDGLAHNVVPSIFEDHEGIIVDGHPRWIDKVFRQSTSSFQSEKRVIWKQRQRSLRKQSRGTFCGNRFRHQHHRKRIRLPNRTRIFESVEVPRYHCLSRG
ncbi:hypothetical protein N8612_08045, partial [Verrucomicrobia bacterium]|nr:hypothetical protein [Verrucomicrobiota bacterium]